MRRNWIPYGRIWTGMWEAMAADQLRKCTDKTRAMGQLFFMGWEGTEVTPQIRTLIEDHHLGAILLTTKNLKSIDHFIMFSDYFALIISHWH